MKIATFNVNNINRRLPNLLQWLKEAKPHIVCLQELKCTDDEFPASAIDRAGYRAIWCGQKTWNGVAILSRDAEPVVTRTTLPGDADDTQARYIEAAIAGVLVGCIYLPNGNPQPGPNSTTSSSGSSDLRATRVSSSEKEHLLSLRGTTTSPQLQSTFTPPSHGTMMRSCSLKAGLRTLVS